MTRLMCLCGVRGAVFRCFDSPRLMCLRAYVLMFPTHTEGGDPDSLHEKKIKSKDFKSELSNTLSLGMLFT